MVELEVNMQNIETLFLINFGACAVSLGLGMLLGYLLFKSLKKNHAKYYKSVGEPIILAPFNITEETYFQLLKGVHLRTLWSSEAFPKVSLKT